MKGRCSEEHLISKETGNRATTERDTWAGLAITASLIGHHCDAVQVDEGASALTGVTKVSVHHCLFLLPDAILFQTQEPRSQSRFYSHSSANPTFMGAQKPISHRCGIKKEFFKIKDINLHA